MSKSVAFIGTGIMGLPMAGHLLNRGYKVTIHSRTKAKAADLLTRGAIWADSPAAAAAGNEIICICVTDTPDVETVLFGPAGVVEGAARGTVVIDHSTISPIITKQLSTRLANNGITMLDGPLSGGDVGARNGTLSIMIGGDKSALEKVRPILESYGKTITHCGESGAGQFTKLVNQVLICGALSGVCEALTLAKRAGLDLATTIAATSGGAAGSWQLANLGPKIAAGDYKPGFMIDLILKDLRLLAEAAGATNTHLPVASKARELFQSAQQSGHGRDGTQALIEAVSALSK